MFLIALTKHVQCLNDNWCSIVTELLNLSRSPVVAGPILMGREMKREQQKLVDINVHLFVFTMLFRLSAYLFCFLIACLYLLSKNIHVYFKFFSFIKKL